MAWHGIAWQGLPPFLCGRGGENSSCLYCPLFDIRSFAFVAAEPNLRADFLPFLPRSINDAFIINNIHTTSIASATLPASPLMLI